MKCFWLFAGTMATCTIASAAIGIDPADPSVSVPAQPYVSPLEAYQRWSDSNQSPTLTWRATNEHIAKQGGMQMDMGDMNMPDGTYQDEASSHPSKTPHDHHPKQPGMEKMPGMTMPHHGGKP